MSHGTRTLGPWWVVWLWPAVAAAAAAGPDGGTDGGGGPEAGAARASAVSVQADRTEVKLGEPVTLTIEVRSDTGASYRLPATLKLKPFVELSRDEGRGGRGGQPQVIRLKLAVYEELGEQKVPEIPLEPVLADGGSAPALQVPAVPIKVASVLQGVEQPTPREVAAPVAIRVRDLRPLVLLGLVVLWLALAFALRFRRAPGPAHPKLHALPPARLAHEIALEKLRALVEEDLLRKGRFHEYFVRVSETLREYLGNRYGFFALDLTSHELLEELRDRPTPGLEHAVLRDLLENADLVKFARRHPDDDLCSRALNTAFALVEATRLVVEPEEEAPA